MAEVMQSLQHQDDVQLPRFFAQHLPGIADPVAEHIILAGGRVL